MKRTIIYLLLFFFVAFQACEKEQDNNSNISIVGIVNKYDKEGIIKEDRANIEVSILGGATSKTNSQGEFNFSGLSSGKYRFKITDTDNSSLYNMATFIGPGEAFLLYEIYEKLNYLAYADLSSFEVTEDQLYYWITNTVTKPGSDSIEYLWYGVVTLYIHSDPTVSNTNYGFYRTISFSGDIHAVGSGFRINDYFDESIDKLYAVYYISNYFEDEWYEKFYNEDFSVRIKSSDQIASEVFEIDIKP